MSENRLNTVDRNTHAIDRRQQSSINYHNDRRHQQDDRRRHYSDECHHQQLLEICLIELNQAKDRYHQLFNLSPIAYIFISSNGQISDLNTSAASLLGGERQTLIHQSFSHFVSQEETERWQKLWLKIQHNEVSMPVDLSLTPLKGKPFLARVENLGKLNKALNNLLAISDISQNQNKINYPDLSTLTFNIQEGLMLTNAELIIQQVNPAFSRITGYDSNEVLGQSPRLLSSGLQEIGFYQTMWDSINHQGYWQGELCNRRKNGEIFPEWLTITSFLDSNGQMFYIGSFIDISNYKQKEKQTLARHQQQELQYQSELQQKNIELQQIKSELNEINTALKVLVQHQQTDTLDAKDLVAQEINQEVIPFLNQLKRGNQNPKQKALLQILETNLKKLSTSYGSKNSLTRLFQELTPKEIQIASMIRQGLPSKYIAATLSISEATINVHRKNIRKKLGIENQAINLRSHLLSFD